MSKLKLIWDFRGADASKIAQHHEIHLQDYIRLEQLENQETGFEDLSDIHSIAYMVINKNEMIPFLSKEPVCRVGTIVIDEKHRSIGLGKALMNKCNGWAISCEASEVRLEVMEFNAKAQNFYTGLGFKTQSRIMSNVISG